MIKENRLVVKTDGMGFIDYVYRNELPGINIIKMRDGASQLFHITEGIWHLNVPTRITVKHDDVNFYDVDSRKHLAPGWIILEDISLVTDLYITYKLTCITFEEVLALLRKDISLLEKGNILNIYNKLQMYDWIYDD